MDPDPSGPRALDLTQPAVGALPAAPFGRMITAMATPFTDDGALDLAGAERLVEHLVAHAHDGVVVSGTTGEAPVTSAAEQADLLRTVIATAAGRLAVVAGCGTNDTAHGREMARAAARAGADGMLVTTPYYSKPTQDGVVAHVEAIAAAADLPVMLYDVPARTGLALATATIVRLAAHPQVVALKDAKMDLCATGEVRRSAPDLAVYCGADELNVPLLALGAVGVVSVLGHLAGDRIAGMIAAYDTGGAAAIAAAGAAHVGLLPAVRGLFAFGSPAPVKAALADLGLIGCGMRLPGLRATAEQLAGLRADLAAAGLAPWSGAAAPVLAGARA